MFQDQQEPARLSSSGASLAPDAPLRADEPGAPGGGPGIEEPTNSRRAITFVRELVETVLLTLVIFVAVRSLVINFRVDGESMHPSLTNGQYLLVNKVIYFHFDLNAVKNVLPGPDWQGKDIVYLFHPPERGDIIVFDPPTHSDKPYVKRVIGLPGDTVAVHDRKVYVNGQALAEDYLQAPPAYTYPVGGTEFTVPAGMIFVLGDNRNNSSDSHAFGPVSIDSVIGKAIISYWPPEGFGLIPHERYAVAQDGH